MSSLAAKSMPRSKAKAAPPAVPAVAVPDGTRSWLQWVQPLVGELPSGTTIALPCVGANSGFRALQELGHRGVAPTHIYDIDPACRKPLEILHGQGPQSPTFHIGPEAGDILRVDPAGLACPDGLLAGPPCTFVAGNGGHEPWAHSGMLVFNQVLCWIENFAQRELKFFVLENVKGLATRYQGQASVLELALARLQRSVPFFEIRVWRLNSKDYTLAQHRERIYIIAMRRSVLARSGRQCIGLEPPVMPRCPLAQFLTRDAPNVYHSELAPSQQENLVAYMKLIMDYIVDPDMQGKFACFDLSRKIDAAYGPKWRVDDVVETLTTNNTQLYIVSLGEGVQKPTVHRWLRLEERARLQGLGPELFAACNASQKKTLTGNAFAVPCIGVALQFIMQVLATAAGTSDRARSRSRSPVISVHSSPEFVGID